MRKYNQYVSKGDREQKNVTVTRRDMGLKEEILFNVIYDLSDPMAIYADTYIILKG